MTCTREDQLVSQWVGIDGFTNQTLEQAGTLEQCFEGTAYYFTWYEMAPLSQVTVGTSVQPGDTISAGVIRSGTTYKLTVTDHTTAGNNVAATATCAAATCLDTSVEWIAERPAFSIGTAPLADFGTWTLSAQGETAKDSFSNYTLNMIDATSSYTLATTSIINSSSFTEVWHNSY